MNIRDRAIPESKPLFADLTEQEKELAKIKASVAIAIAKRRIELGMTQKEFAKHLGITQGMVSRLESGEYNYSIEKLHEVCFKSDLDFDPSIKPRRKESAAVWLGNQRWVLGKKPILAVVGGEGVA